MKQKGLRKILLLVVSALVCSISFLCVSLAKYTTTDSDTQSAPVAKWNLTLAKQSAEYSFDEFSQLPFLAPGSEGSFKIVIQNASDVKANYTVTADTEDAPKAFSVTVASPTGTLDTTDSVEVTINWAWEFDQSENDDNDWFNTTDYEKMLTIKVTVAGEQFDPSLN